ncbi:putative Ankyrin repeat protein, partial [Operophtera brumata]
MFLTKLFQPLFWAVHHNQPEILELLVAHGARVTEVDKSGRSPLEIAKSHEYDSIIEILNKHLNIDDTVEEDTHLGFESQMTS